MNSNHPWHITVVRTRGILFVRREKSWRPIVTISVVDRNRDHGLPHEVVLGSDGQNPNLKSVIPVHDVNHSTRLDIQIFHKSQTKKKHRKRNLVGSASLSFNEFLNKHPLPHARPVEYDLRLSCPPPQRKSPTIGGRQQHSATLTMRFFVPQNGLEPASGSYEPDSRPLSPISDHQETEGLMSDAACSSKALSYTIVSSTPENKENRAPWGKQPQSDRLDGTAGLRRRKKRRGPKGFHIDSESDGNLLESEFESESDGESCFPQTPEEEHFPPIYENEPAFGDWEGEEGVGMGKVEEEEGIVLIAPSVLPLHADQMSVMSVRASLSFAEAVIDRFAPYHELREAEEGDDFEKAEKVLGRLLTEWYVIGASLLALAGIDAAVFGFAPGALFAVDGFSKGAVSIGAIAAGIGLVCDAWFLVLYSGANVQKFQRLAKDVYGSYFFFCLSCRLPTVCMFLSALALMSFLFAVAWAAWPTAVLVMSFVAGLLLTSQFLVFGIHRLVNFVIWLVRVSWRNIAGRRSSSSQATATTAGAGAGGRPAPAHGEQRMEMPVPVAAAPPAHATALPKLEIVWVEPGRERDHEAQV